MLVVYWIKINSDNQSVIFQPEWGGGDIFNSQYKRWLDFLVVVLANNSTPSLSS